MSLRKMVISIGRVEFESLTPYGPCGIYNSQSRKRIRNFIATIGIICIFLITKPCQIGVWSTQNTSVNTWARIQIHSLENYALFLAIFRRVFVLYCKEELRKTNYCASSEEGKVRTYLVFFILFTRAKGHCNTATTPLIYWFLSEGLSNLHLLRINTPLSSCTIWKTRKVHNS